MHHAIAALLVIGSLASAALTQNDCPGTATQGIGTSLSCTGDPCGEEQTCEEASASDDISEYTYCACGGEEGEEPDCCHVIVREVLGPNFPAPAGNCEDCGLPASGNCQLEGFTTVTAGCWYPVE
jgi:hypothetical protein